MSPRGFKLPVPVEKAAKKLSKLLGTRPRPLSRAPSTGTSLSTAALPIGIIEEILLHLPGRDIFRMKQVSRAFDGLISTSPFLEYGLELFAAGLIDNPRFSCSLEEGRKQVKEYVDVWKNLHTIEKRSHVLRLRDFRWRELVSVGRDLLARRSGCSVSFIRVPCTTAGRQGVEEWMVDPPITPFWPCTFAVYSPEHVLALVEWRHPVFQIRLLNAKDGSPHHLPMKNVIMWDTGLDDGSVNIPCAKMTASRLMLFVSTSSVNILAVWDWRTGSAVLKRSDLEDISIRHRHSAFTFLDEFRFLASTGEIASREDELDLVMFDTSLPQQSPNSWRRLNIAPAHHKRYALNPWEWEARIHTDSERSQGEGSRDGPLIVDPTQSVVVIVLHHRERVGLPGGDAILVIRATALIKYLSSTPSGPSVPWDDWKRDVMVVEFPNNGTSYVWTFVLGTRVLLMTCDRRGNYVVQGYDFSQRGCTALVRVGDGVKERKVMPDLGRVWSPREPNHEPESMRTLGDSLVMSTVGGLQLSYTWTYFCYEKVTTPPSEVCIWELA